MIVYGDPSFIAPLGALIADLCAAFAACAAAPTLDGLRALVIRAGQLEQAVLDAPAAQPGDDLRAWCHAATAEAARAFCAAWSDQRPTTNDRPMTPLPFAFCLLPCAFSVTVNVPEGFAFYALYPEQYAAAAAQWLAARAEDAPRRALVVGVRSIGTTLGAVVAAALAAAGWEVASISVRPTGHPFARAVDMGGQTFEGALWALVVDEGPGLSGSSMAAAAAALVRAGVARERLAFLPGHAGEPGSAASEDVRAWWRDTPRYVGALALGGRTLPDALAAATAALCDDAVVRVEDFGGGQWRAALYDDPAQWPAVCAPFERPKYRCTTRGGTQVLWKFAGLGDRRQEIGDKRQETGDRIFGAAHGFVAQQWRAGVPLTHGDATPALLAQIGRSIAECAAPLLAAEQQRAALERLAEMVYWNVWEGLGAQQAAHTRALAEAALRHAEAALPAAGDGRLAPHEWLRLPAGAIIKLDCEGTDSDHTIVGRQPVAWDVAGALCEWRLDAAGAAALLRAYHAAGGAPLPAALLAFYRLAYAAFKLGQCALCAAMTSDAADEARLRAAAAHYEAAICNEVPFHD